MLNISFRGNVVCDEILCPSVTCEKPFLPEGECCPLCNVTTGGESGAEAENESGGCFLEGDQVLHPPGSRWHPYIPPFGFSRCATCTCDPESMKVECESQKCPRLDCPADQQIRPDALACCKVKLVLARKFKVYFAVKNSRHTCNYGLTIFLQFGNSFRFLARKFKNYKRKLK